MRITKQQKAPTEQRIEFRQWRQWHRARVETLLVGYYAGPTKALLSFLKNMNSARALIKFVESGPWCNADEDTRYEVLGLIDAAIIARRERMKLAPLDDTHYPTSAFLILRARLASHEIPLSGVAPSDLRKKTERKHE
jgi:hypothetical protein